MWEQPYEAIFYGDQDAKIARPLSVVNLFYRGDIRVVPIMALDFSMGNITHDEGRNLHSTNPKKPNDYRDLMRMISQSYGNVLNLPIFGYGAKTCNYSPKATAMFPLSRSIRNPFVPNDPETLQQTYTDCLAQVQQSVPVNLNPLLLFLRQLGTHVKNRLNRKASNNPAIRDSCDSFYVMYVMSCGILDDVAECMKTLQLEWAHLPLQLHIVSLAPSHLSLKDQDSLDLMQESHRLNHKIGWP